MKILHITPSYWPAKDYGGIPASVGGLCAALSLRGHDITVHVPDREMKKDKIWESKNAGVTIRHFPIRLLKKLLFSPEHVANLKQTIKQYEIVHLHGLYSCLVTQAAAVCRKAGVPYLMAPRGMLGWKVLRMRGFVRKLLWLTFLERQNLEGAAAIHASSAVEENDVHLMGFAVRRIVVIPNGLKIDGDDPGGSVKNDNSKRFARSEKTLLFLGRINWKKGLDRLIYAMKEIPNARLLIAGQDDKGYENKMKDLAKKTGIQDRIQWLGPVYGAEKMALYKRADLFVLPSHSENFGNTVLEAMSAGCPAVVTSEVGACDVIKRSGGGLITSADPHKLAESINSLMQQPEQLAIMSRKAQQIVREEYNWETIAEQTEKIYETILRERKGSHGGLCNRD